MISCNLCEHFRTTDADPVGLLRAVVSLCWSHLVTTTNEQLWLDSTWKPDETPSFASEERSWSSCWSETETWLVEPAGAPVSFLNPTSGPGGGFSPSCTPHSQPSAAFSPAPTPFVASGHFVHKDFPSCSQSLLPLTSKFLQRRVRPPVKPVNVASQQLVEGWDFYLWLSETQSGATFEACQSTGPRGKAYCPQIDPTPLVLFI